MNQLIMTVVFNTDTQETNFSITQMGDAEPNLANITVALSTVQRQVAANVLATIQAQQGEEAESDGDAGA